MARRSKPETQEAGTSSDTTTSSGRINPLEPSIPCRDAERLLKRIAKKPLNESERVVTDCHVGNVVTGIIRRLIDENKQLRSQLAVPWESWCREWKSIAEKAHLLYMDGESDSKWNMLINRMNSAARGCPTSIFPGEEDEDG